MKAEKKRIIRDICLIVFLLGLGILLMLTGRKDGTVAEIRIDGELYGSYSLYESREIRIEKDGELLGVAVIDDGKILMKSAACKGGDCVKRGAASHDGDCILCLPSGISITVGNSDLDGVTG